MSPILVRPVREQFEHDRVIRLLHTRWRRRFEVAANVSGEPPAPLRFGVRTLFPDLILTTNDRARRLHSIVEVETNESINHLEAMAQWMPYARVRAPFHLYVPVGSVDGANRLCAEMKIVVDEVWTYHTIGSQVRFALVQRAPASAQRYAKLEAQSKARTKARAKAKPKPKVKSKSKTKTKTARKGAARTKAKGGASSASRRASGKTPKRSRAAKSRKTAARATKKTTAAAGRSAGRKTTGKRRSRG